MSQIGGKYTAISIDDSALADTTDAQVAARLPRLIAFVLQRLFLHPETEVAVSFVDVAEMSRLHEQWMGLTGPTDVMSFPMDQIQPGTVENQAAPGVLGDVVICLPVAQEQADAAEHPLASEIEMLVTHSLLHLVGYDHDSPVAEAEMFDLQRKLLADFAECELS